MRKKRKEGCEPIIIGVNCLETTKTKNKHYFRFSALKKDEDAFFWSMKLYCKNIWLHERPANGLGSPWVHTRQMYKTIWKYRKNPCLAGRYSLYILDKFQKFVLIIFWYINRPLREVPCILQNEKGFCAFLRCWLSLVRINQPLLPVPGLTRLFLSLLVVPV